MRKNTDKKQKVFYTLHTLYIEIFGSHSLADCSTYLSELSPQLESRQSTDVSVFVVSSVLHL